MTTAKAIATLREKSQLSQQEFADKLGITNTSVSRWENGRSEPNREALQKLSAISKSLGATHLQDFFEAKVRASIQARIERSNSAGSERHIPEYMFELWMARTERLYSEMGAILNKTVALTGPQQKMIVKHWRGLVEQLWKDFRPYRADQVEDLDPDRKPSPLYGLLHPEYGGNPGLLDCFSDDPRRLDHGKGPLSAALQRLKERGQSGEPKE